MQAHRHLARNGLAPCKSHQRFVCTHCRAYRTLFSICQAAQQESILRRNPSTKALKPFRVFGGVPRGYTHDAREQAPRTAEAARPFTHIQVPRDPSDAHNIVLEKELRLSQHNVYRIRSESATRQPHAHASPRSAKPVERREDSPPTGAEKIASPNIRLLSAETWQRRDWRKSFDIFTSKIAASGEDPELQQMSDKQLTTIFSMLCEGTPFTRRQRSMSRIMKYLLWKQLMLKCLREDASKALALLKASTTIERSKRFYSPSPRNIFDCLQYITLRSDEFDLGNAAIIENLSTMWHEQMKTFQGENVMDLTYLAVTKLVSLYNQKQFDLLLEDIWQNNVRLRARSLCMLAERGAQSGSVEKTIQILQVLLKYRAPSLLLKVCVLLLRRQYDVEDLYKYRNGIATALLEIGMPPSPLLFSCFIQNEMEAGRYESALQLFDVAKSHDVQPRDGSYSVLLKAALHERDPQTTEALSREIRQNRTLFSNDILFFDLFYVLFKTQTITFPNRLALYLEMYDPRPLQELGVFEAHADVPATSPRKHPTRPILSSIYVAYLIYNQTSPAKLLGLYDTFMTLVREKHPTIEPLAWGDYTINGFIKVFGKHRNTLDHAVRVIREMASRADGVEQTPESARQRYPFHPTPPSVDSFLHLCRGFLFNRQPQAVSRSIDIMRKNNIEPHKGFWKSMIKGHSQALDIEGAISALEEMAKAGFAVDDWTMGYMEKAYNRYRYGKAIEDNLRDGKTNRAEELDLDRIVVSREKNSVGQFPSFESRGELRRNLIKSQALLGTRLDLNLENFERAFYEKYPSHLVPAQSSEDEVFPAEDKTSPTPPT